MNEATRNERSFESPARDLFLVPSSNVDKESSSVPKRMGGTVTASQSTKPSAHSSVESKDRDSVVKMAKGADRDSRGALQLAPGSDRAVMSKCGSDFESDSAKAVAAHSSKSSKHRDPMTTLPKVETLQLAPGSDRAVMSKSGSDFESDSAKAVAAHSSKSSKHRDPMTTLPKVETLQLAPEHEADDAKAAHFSISSKDRDSMTKLTDRDSKGKLQLAPGSGRGIRLAPGSDRAIMPSSDSEHEANSVHAVAHSSMASRSKDRKSLTLLPKRSDRDSKGKLQLAPGSGRGIRRQSGSQHGENNIVADAPTVRPGAVPIQGIGGSDRGELQDYLTIDEDRDSVDHPPMLEGRLAEDMEQGSQARKDMPLAMATAVADDKDQTDLPGINFKDRRIQCGIGVIVIGLIGLVIGIAMAVDPQSDPVVRSSAPSAMPSDLPTISPTMTPAPSNYPTSQPSDPPTHVPSSNPTTPAPSPNPTAAPTNAPSISSRPTMEATFSRRFSEKSILDISANYDQLDCDVDYDTCYNRNAIAFSQTGKVLATRAGMEINLWGLTDSNEWQRLQGVPPLPLTEGLRHKQNLCLVSLEADNTDIHTVALAFANHVAVFQFTAASQWVQLGGDFEELVRPEGMSSTEGGISVQLDTNSSLYSPNVDDPDSIVLAIATTNYTNGSSRTKLYEYNQQNAGWESVLGGDGEIVSPWVTAHPLSLSLGGGGTKLAIGVILFTGTGRVQVYGRPGYSWCYGGTDDGSWCKLGEEISSGNYEDLSASSVALSQSSDTLAVGTPGFFDCPMGNQCSLVRVYTLPDRAPEPVWVPIGQPIMAFEESGGSGELVQQSGLGFRVDISANGETVAVTREGYNHEGDPGIYLFHLEHNVWQEEFGYTWHVGNDLDQPLVVALAPLSPFSLACGIDGNVTVFHNT